MKTETKNTQLRQKFASARLFLIENAQMESHTHSLRLCFSFWRSCSQVARLATALQQTETARASEVTELQNQLAELRRLCTSSKQDFRRATLSLDRLQEDHLALKQELQLWRAKAESVQSEQSRHNEQVDKLTVENIQMRAKLSEALESLAAAESADSDIGVLFKKYRQLETQYRILKKTLYPESSPGVFQCNTCKSHVLHRSTVSSSSTSWLPPLPAPQSPSTWR
jgi:septal ring factor EnvC (AmiA/AmiB activator)